MQRFIKIDGKVRTDITYPAGFMGESPGRRQISDLPFVGVRTVMENLEKSWNFKMVISRPGKVMEKT